jgi:hypothetical protein
VTDTHATRQQMSRRTVGGYVWFALMLGGWTVFFVLLVFAQSTVGELWRELRDLPIVVEGLVWLLLFPFVLATAVWESSWDEWLRLLLVSMFALVWSALFFPRKRQPS